MYEYLLFFNREKYVIIFFILDIIYLIIDANRRFSRLKNLPLNYDRSFEADDSINYY